MLSDPIADMLTRIRNAYAVRLLVAKVSYSKVKHALAEVLVREGYLAGVEVSDVPVKKELLFKLKYKHNRPAVKKMQRISKPGRRLYSQVKKFKPVLSGLGLEVVSTSRGLMTAREAHRQNIGGEIICRIW